MNIPLATSQSKPAQGIVLRLFRKKYNAEQPLENFAAIARDKVDMDKLTAALFAIVDETMRPERLTLWLKPTTDSHMQNWD